MVSKKESSTLARSVAGRRQAVEAQKTVARFQKVSLERFVAFFESPAVNKLKTECKEAIGDEKEPGYLMAGATKVNVHHVTTVIDSLLRVAKEELAEVSGLLVEGKKTKIPVKVLAEPPPPV